MSTLAYAAITTTRERSPSRASKAASPPGFKTYVDAFAALVPSEVLTLHALILPVTTKTAGATTEIVDATTLSWSFYGLLVMALLLYVVARAIAGKWERLDVFRAAIPPLAFVGWTMLQRATAFDAVFPNMPQAPRTVVALFLGVVLAAATTVLAGKADAKEP